MSETFPEKEDKHSIRKRILSIRRALDEEYVHKASAVICDKITQLSVYRDCAKLCIYMPVQNEVDTAMLCRTAWKDGKMVYLPRVLSDTGSCRMDFYLYSPGTKLVKGAYNILEPQASEVIEHPDKDTLIIMPGAVFSRDMKRIGYGGGYYDRYLAEHPACMTVAAAYDFQVLDEIPSEAYDISPGVIITESYELH